MAHLVHVDRPEWISPSVQRRAIAVRVGVNFQDGHVDLLAFEAIVLVEMIHATLALLALDWRRHGKQAFVSRDFPRVPGMPCLTGDRPAIQPVLGRRSIKVVQWCLIRAQVVRSSEPVDQLSGNLIGANVMVRPTLCCALIVPIVISYLFP